MISMVVPTRNRAHTLRLVAPSYYEQAGVSEIIFVSDAGDDATPEVVDGLAKAYPTTRTIFVRNPSRLNSFKYAPAILSRRQAAKAYPSRIELLRLGIIGMVVLSIRVGLPNFQHGIVDRETIAIQHAKRDPHALPPGLGTGNAVETVLVSGQLDCEKWTDRLRGRRD